MDAWIVYLLDLTSYISAIFIIIIGCFAVAGLLISLLIYLLNFVYVRTEGVIHFFSYLRNRKEFKQWKKEQTK